MNIKLRQANEEDAEIIFVKIIIIITYSSSNGVENAYKNNIKLKEVKLERREIKEQWPRQLKCSPVQCAF